jgi:hypothetical protein
MRLMILEMTVSIWSSPISIWDIWSLWSGWPAICRVKLVGCPGGGASWLHWRYESGLEMIPTGTARNAFTVTTDGLREGRAATFPFSKLRRLEATRRETKTQSTFGHVRHLM